jgi:hypothetical protein
MVSTKRQNRRKGGARKGKRPQPRGSKGKANTFSRQAVPVAYTAPVVHNNTATKRVFAATEFLASPSLLSSATTGTVVYEVDINPAEWVTTRAAAEASLWGYYRFKKCVFIFESSAPTSFGGQVAVGCDTSVGTERGITSPAIIGYVLALSGSKTFNVWQTSVVPFDCSPNFRPYNWFQSSISDPENGPANVTGSQGRLTMVLTAPVSNVTVLTTVTWTLRVDYVIEFGRPELITTNPSTAVAALPQGTSLNWNSMGQTTASGGLTAIGLNQVVLCQPPIEEWFTANSPTPRFFVATTSGTITAWSTYPLNSGTEGDCIGPGTGISSLKPCVLYACGYI